MAYSDTSLTERSNRRYISATMDAPVLERDYESNLARRWTEKRDERAMHEIIEAHARLVVRIAAGFRSSGLPMADLIQEGNIGLMEAVERFDYEREVRFSTYASWWIVASIQNYILRNSS
ncbi:MAG: sigma-70 family RNA polymerase sigma factor, partial [Bauldia litoralis]